MKYLISGISIFILGFIISFLLTGLASSSSSVEHIGMATMTAVIASCTILILKVLDSIDRNLK